MAKKTRYVALDLGAESGRVMLAEFDGDRLSLSESYRFANRPVRVLDGLHWDVLGLWRDIQTGLGKVSEQSGGDVASIGLDTWGVDYALLSRSGDLIGLPYHYRDSRNHGMTGELLGRASREEIFEQTGTQFMDINTVCQLLSVVRRDPRALDHADTLLMMPDLFNYWLSGERTAEHTIATTTQCYHPGRRVWARRLLDTLGIPVSMFLDTVQPGTELGALWPSVADGVELPRVPVVAPACHDSGSAIAAVPVAANNLYHAFYISSGTWSVVGTEWPEPVINDQALQYNFTNEGAVCSRTRFMTNVAGLWLVQQCRHTWAAEGERYSYADLTAMADDATPFQAVIDVDYAEFLKPGDMPARVREYCGDTGQAAPSERGAIIRTILESLALKYRVQLDRLEAILSRDFPLVHIVGGGTQNDLLNQLTADATCRPVLAGPVEATALGNVLMQALSLGAINSLQQGRDLVRQSFPLKSFEPHSEESGSWDEGYEQLLRLMGQEQGES